MTKTRCYEHNNHMDKNNKNSNAKQRETTRDNAKQQYTMIATIHRDSNKKGRTEDGDKRMTTNDTRRQRRRRRLHTTGNNSNNKNKNNNPKKTIQVIATMTVCQQQQEQQEQEQLRKTTIQTTIQRVAPLPGLFIPHTKNNLENKTSGVGGGMCKISTIVP